MTTTESTNSSNTTWCDICQLECRSEIAFLCHTLGKPHRLQANLPVLTFAEQRNALKEQRHLMGQEMNLQVTEPPRVATTYSATRNINTTSAATAPSSTTRPTQTTPTPSSTPNPLAAAATLHGSSLEYARYIAPGVDEFGCFVDGNSIPNEDSLDDSRIDKVDLSRLDDTERMKQQEYEDAVVEVALFNYAQYHNLDPQTVKFAQVEATSAGIEGWASCVLSLAVAQTEGNSNNDDDNNNNGEDRKLASKKAVKGDEVEARALRQALLESMGTRVTTPHVQVLASLYQYQVDDDDSVDEDASSADDDDDEDSYDYEDDEYENEEYSDDEHDESDDNTNTSKELDGSSWSRVEEKDSDWSVVSHTSSSYAMPDAVDFAKESALGDEW